MPFTVAHAAAAVPLNRRPLVLGGLVAGSIAPDLPFYFYAGWQPVSSQLTHSWRGTLLVDVPIALLLLLAARVLARPLATLAPAGLLTRLGPVIPPGRLEPGVRPVLWLLLSLWLGALTHVCWDGLTHRNGFVVRNVPPLRVRVAEGSAPVHLYEVLQQLSTFLGLAVLVVVVLRWLRRTPAGEPPVPAASAQVRLWVLVGTAALAGALALEAALDTPPRFTGADVVRGVATRIALGGVVGVVLAAGAYAAVWWLFTWRAAAARTDD